MLAICNRARRIKQTVEIFGASLADIHKALQSKPKPNLADILPDWLHPELEAFSQKGAKELPPHRPGIDHEINLLMRPDGAECEIPAMPLIQMPTEQLVVLQKTLYDLLDSRFIRASNSAAAAPVIFVKKPGGGLRFVTDYRGLNEISQKDRYPLPLIDETLKLIASAKRISRVDVISAFHRIRMRAGDEWKTAFRTRLGSYEWLVTPFGLCGAPATFQRYIKWVLRDEPDICCSAYLDDVGIFSNGSQAEHRELVKVEWT